MNEKEFKVFFEIYNSDKALYLRDIVKRTNMPYGTVQGIINKNKYLFDIKIEGKNKYFSFRNNISNKYLFHQIEIERTKVFIQKNPRLRPFIEKMQELKTPFLVFGSFAKDTACKNSDLDLLFISGKKETPDHLCPIEIHKIFINPKKISELKKEALYREIIKEHVIIFGYDLFLTEVFE